MTNKYLLGSFSTHVAVKENSRIMNVTETLLESVAFHGNEDSQNAWPRPYQRNILVILA